ncbi:MAG TPA: AGE family epimerase/isomerase [Asticcacaulis sp.]|nr:AGE family epimerase/isomerase [Asticcacaulis sp.]
MPSAPLRSLEDAKTHARQWLFDYAAPLWASEGICGDGMFAERLTLDGKRVDMPRRLRVQARQIYSFCAIGQLGWNGPWREIVTRAVDILLAKGRRSDGLFVHLFSPEGDVVNQSLDLYDHAFGLFALAHAGHALGRSDLLTIAEDIQAKLDADWWREAGGYWEGELTPCPPYRQNPHMHMLETAYANWQASGSEAWRMRLDRLGTLFENKFWDPQSGAVTEYFDDAWNRLDGPDGRIVEPGHCLEWAWLFEVALPSKTHISDGLTCFARQHGVDAERGVAFNEVWLDGRPKDQTARLWPQTERLKAAMARLRRTGDASEMEEAVKAYTGLALYFETPARGVWRDRLKADDAWIEEDAPASSFYHIVCALTELLN